MWHCGVRSAKRRLPVVPKVTVELTTVAKTARLIAKATVPTIAEATVVAITTALKIATATTIVHMIVVRIAVATMTALPIAVAKVKVRRLGPKKGLNFLRFISEVQPFTFYTGKNYICRLDRYSLEITSCESFSNFCRYLFGSCSSISSSENL